MSAIANAVTKTQKEMSLEKDKAVQLALSQVEQAVTEAVAASEEAAEIALGQALGKMQEDASQREAELMHQVAELEDQIETLMEQGESSNNGLQAMLNRFQKLADEHNILARTLQVCQEREVEAVESMRRAEQEKDN